MKLTKQEQLRHFDRAIVERDKEREALRQRIDDIVAEIVVCLKRKLEIQAEIDDEERGVNSRE